MQRGFLFPDYDDVPAQQLGLVLGGEGGTFWASSWHDTDEHALEDLAQILEEIRLRHERRVELRKAEREREIALRQQEDKDRIAAEAEYRKRFIADAMKDQAKNWEEAGRLRRYAAAIRGLAAARADQQMTRWSGLGRSKLRLPGSIRFRMQRNRRRFQILPTATSRRS